MSKLDVKILKLCCALLAAGAAVWGGPPASAVRQDLPAGPGVETVRAKCIGCHEADLIVSQRLSPAGWTREVEKMVRWGAVVSDAEKGPMVAYLAAHFGPRAQAAAGDGPGRKIFESQCLTCHEADLTEQQRLSPAGWTREVEKMVRWGAVVSDAEKEPLVDYLSKSFGPGAKPK